MGPTWHAREKEPDERVRNPIGGSYFADEAIDKPAQALVRELLQNARDASTRQSAVRVRMSVHEGDEALPETSAKHWFGAVWRHLRAPDSGVAVEAAEPGAMRFLVVEDFGTCGLTGDAGLTKPPPENRAPKERFFAFVRAEWYTNKESGRGGSWGVGKTVFWRSSDINTVFAYSVRDGDPRRVLIGQTVLCYHEVGGKTYAPDVMWGTRRESDRLVLPVSDDAILDRFRRDFRVRREDEPGLTVVVPMLEKEITARTLLEHTIREYFLPILRGDLIIEIAGRDVPGGSVELHAANLAAHVDALRDREADELRPLVRLGEWIRSEPKPHELVRPATGAPSWAESLPDELAKTYAPAFLRDEPLAFRVPVLVRRSGGETQESYFDVFMQREPANRPCKPVFIRNGIVIPKVRERALRSLRLHAIVLAEDGALAELLRDAEGPGHTHWSAETKSARQQFKRKYVGGLELIRFVESAPRAIAERLLATQQERDTTSLADDFPVPLDEAERRVRQRRKRRGQEQPEHPDIRDRKPRAFVIEERKGGFVVRRDDPAAPLPSRLRIRVAYDRSRGNPFKHYHTADFKLNQAPIRCQLTGVREVTRHRNELVVDVLSDAFRIEVNGFDLHRDLVVDVRPMKVAVDEAEAGDALEAVA